ncbi:MAG: ABC transporter ATP-binding protein [Candidatus Aminicenantia bacterium]
MIKIIDLHKSFDGKVVLEGVNLDIYDGEIMVIMGGSGAGKTILIKHIIGLLKPDRGKIFVDEIEITALKEDELFKVSRLFGMVFQGAALFDSMTVEENIRFGLERLGLTEEEIRERVKDSLERVGLPGIQSLMPSQLSGGMKKRVGLARAIALRPRILLYDEPTTGVDPIRADSINRLIIKMRDDLGITSVVITHDIVSAFRVADRIAMLHAGKIIEVGTPEQVKNSHNPIVQQFIKGESEGPVLVF